MTALAATETIDKPLTSTQREVLAALSFCFKADAFGRVDSNKTFSRIKTLYSRDKGTYEHCFAVACPTRTMNVLLRDGWIEKVPQIPGYYRGNDYRLSAKALATVAPDSQCDAAKLWRSCAAARGYDI